MSELLKDVSLIEEVAGRSRNLTTEQEEHLRRLDWYIEELGTVIEENKEYGILQAHWRHRERFEKWLYE